MITPTVSRSLLSGLLFAAVVAVAGIWGVVALVHTSEPAVAQDDASSTADPASSVPVSPAETNGLTDAGFSRIAYVNMERVIRNYPRWWYRVELIDNYRQNLAMQLQELQSRVQQLRADVEGDLSGSDEAYENFVIQATRLEQMKEEFEARIQNAIRELSAQVYNDAYDAIGGIAGVDYDTVLNVVDRRILQGTQAEFFQKISLRAVIVHPESHELTREVVLKMEVDAVASEQLRNAIAIPVDPQGTRTQIDASTMLQEINSRRAASERESLQAELEAAGLTDELNRLNAALGNAAPETPEETPESTEEQPADESTESTEPATGDDATATTEENAGE